LDVYQCYRRPDLGMETANAPALAGENIADSVVNLVKTRKRVCKECKFLQALSSSPYYR
jgi:hypothetical protein